MEENEKTAEKLTEEVAEETKPAPEAEPIEPIEPKKTIYGDYCAGNCDENPIATSKAKAALSKA